MYMRSNVRPSWKTIQPIVKKNVTRKLGQHMRSQSTAFISFAPNIWTVSRDALSLEIYEGEQNKMRNTPSIDWLIDGHVLLLSKRPWSDFLYWVNSFWFVLKYNKRLITWNITHKVRLALRRGEELHSNSWLHNNSWLCLPDLMTEICLGFICLGSLPGRE